MVVTSQSIFKTASTTLTCFEKKNSAIATLAPHNDELKSKNIGDWIMGK
ncbi:MAG: hypothetical protein HON78_03945 [Legionellales bacterium]|nr:hypothetical protein [Legionellales bacterium]